MRNKKQELEIINWVLDYCGKQRPYAAEFIFEITNCESNGFMYSTQMGDGPARGEIQMEMATYYDIVDNYLSYRPKMMYYYNKLNNEDFPEQWNLRTDKKLQYFMCNCSVLRMPEAIPSTKKERAKLWKKRYNTEGGKGTPAHYLKLNK